MKIIRAGLGEVAGVAELFDLYRQFYGQPPDLELARTFLTARIERQESVVFVALDDQGQTLGFTQLYPTFSSEAAAPLFILNDLFVRSSLRQQGTGTALLNTAKKFAQGREPVACASPLQLPTRLLAACMSPTGGWKRPAS